MQYKDYYKTLGVPRTATDKDVKAAYRRLARKHHPDVNPGNRQAEARFKEINEAHAVLSDPEKRRRYDELGSEWSSVQPRSPGMWPGGRVRVNVGATGVEGLGDFSDFFRTFFGGQGFGGRGGVEEVFGRGRGGSSAPAGPDVEHAIDLTLEEVFRGTTRTIEVGIARPPRRVEVRIPAGVREGSRVRVAGEGGRGGSDEQRGDLYLRVRIASHPVFEPNGDDLLTTLRVPITTAVLGGETQVPTLDGAVGIKVPPGTPVGRMFRLRGQGLPRLDAGGGRGDLLASLSVELPKDLSPREKELFEELRKLGR